MTVKTNRKHETLLQYSHKDVILIIHNSSIFFYNRQLHLKTDGRISLKDFYYRYYYWYLRYIYIYSYYIMLYNSSYYSQ